MTEQALHAFEAEHGVELEKITKIPLEGDGTIERRVGKYVFSFGLARSTRGNTPSRSLTHDSIPRLYTNLLANTEWIADLHAADAIIVATHSQGSIVSTHLLDRLIRDGHIVTRKNIDAVRGDALKNIAMAVGEGGVVGGVGAGAAGADGAATREVQRVCCLALCGIHLGPLRYLSSSTLVGPYLQVSSPAHFLGRSFGSRAAFVTHPNDPNDLCSYFVRSSISSPPPRVSCSSSR